VALDVDGDGMCGRELPRLPPACRGTAEAEPERVERLLAVVDPAGNTEITGARIARILLSCNRDKDAQ
jgi:hypothetical protein